MLYNPESRSSRELLAIRLLGKLEECGFAPLDQEGTKEAVFSREVHGTEGKIRVLVYTTIIAKPDGRFEVRDCGEDSIRVCAVYRSERTDSERGLVKETRTHRTGEISNIITRVHQRMREVYGKARTGHRCKKCGAPTFKSKKGNQVCADLCWKSADDLKKESRRNQNPSRNWDWRDWNNRRATRKGAPGRYRR